MRKIQAIFVALVLLLMLPIATAQASNPVQDARNGVVRIVNIAGDGSGNAATGSGICIGQKGKPIEYIITNAHVVGDIYNPEEPFKATDGIIAIVFDDIEADTTLEAKIVKIFDDVDLAIIRLDTPTTLREPMRLMSALNVDVTDTVYAIGFPAASDDSNFIESGIDDLSVTKGTVSKKEINILGESYLQVDASINAGNSGGPLVTEDGYVVGINSRTSTMGANTNFALYIDYAMDFMDQVGIAYEKSNGAPAVTPAPQAPSPAPEVPQTVPDEPIQAPDEPIQAPVEEPAATPEEVVVPPDSSSNMNQTPTGGPNILLIVGGIALLALLGGGIYLLITKRSKPGSGGKLKDDPKFSPPPPEVIWTCPHCGVKNDARFCASCGREKPGPVFRGPETEYEKYDPERGSGGFVKGGLKNSHDMNFHEDEKRSGSGSVTGEHFKKPTLKSSMGTTIIEKSDTTSTPAPRMKSSIHTEAGSGAGRVSTESADKPLEPKAKLKSTISAPTATSTMPTDPEANSYFKRPKNL